MTIDKYANWQVSKDTDNILWLMMDRAGSSVNSINAGVVIELAKIIDEVKADPSIGGVVIGSAKKHGFIAGADIEQFIHFKSEQEAFDLVRQAQVVFDQLEALNVPTVAMIDGFCLGGGTELALACRYRIAEDGPKTRIGLPEVKLGIHPGWGGTVRLPRLIGAPMAMDIILTGRTISAKAAAKMGMVDAAVPRRQLKRAACYYVLAKPAKHRPTRLQALTNNRLIRSLLAKKMYRELERKIKREHYPAPYAVVDNWARDGAVGDQAMINEAKSIAHLFVTSTARNLIRVFFLQTRMKGLGKGIDFNPQYVHVIGAGTMGGDIAAWCALNGLQVTLQDREPKYIAPAIKRAYELFKSKFKSPHEIEAAMDRLLPDPDGLGVNRADVVIEAIFENLAAKQQLFQSIETKLKPHALLATNTSSIPLDEISQVLEHPERLVGIHFFNPVAKMQLVEVVAGDKTSQEAVQNAISFVRRIDRLPLPVKSHPGFLVNRVLMPYLLEAVQLLEEGYSKESIDKAAIDYGMPMGPVELADTVGLDVCLSVAENLISYYGGQVPQVLRTMVRDGHLGRKTGEGFYSYKNGKKMSKARGKQENSLPLTPEVTERLIGRMLNESVACLREGIVADADLLDAGMIFGTGFAPFRGGPINYAKNYGVTNEVAVLNELAQKYDARFKPDMGWQKIK